MAVIYRAMWTDKAGSDAFDRLRKCAASWAQDTTEPSPLVEGKSQVEISQGRQRDIHYRKIDNGAFELQSSDYKPGEATVWTTVIQVVLDDSGLHSLVENRMESDDLALRVSVGRPRVVREMLQAAVMPKTGPSRLLLEPQAVPAEGIDILTDLLADPARTLPIIVCSEPGGDHDGSWLKWAKKIASRSEGVALVITLDGQAVTAFRASLGDLAIWGGGIRIYVPTIVATDSDGWRHRYYLRSRLEQSNHTTIDRIVYSVAQLSTRRRIPEAFAVFHESAGLSRDALDGKVSLVELETSREQWEFELDLALAELSELEKELAKATGHLARLKEELVARGLSELLWGTQHEVDAGVPDEVQDTSEAVLAAQSYLSNWLGIPDSGPQELDDIDTAPNSFAWGNSCWRGLRALAAYAEDRANGWDGGGFWEWCAGGPPLGWPATSKKLSMTESQSVQTSEKLRRARVFPVDSAVDSSGRVQMLAHLKIAEGGGNLAPRVYFHDDTSGVTGKVHIGLVGPHYLVPNKSG